MRVNNKVIGCDLQGRKINFTNSKTLVGWSVSRPRVTQVTFDLPECQEPFKKSKKKNLKRYLLSPDGSKNVTRNREAIEEK